MSIQTLKLEISGMTCDHCARTIEKKVSSVKGLVSKFVSFPEKKGEFEFDSDKVSKSEIIKVINSIGNYKIVGKIKETKDKDLIKKLQNAEKNINEATLKFDKLKG